MVWDPYLYADEHCIFVEEYDLRDPLLGLYVMGPDTPPTILFSPMLRANPCPVDAPMAEEVGHHETSNGFSTVRQYTTCQDVLNVSRVKHQARRWVVKQLIPNDELWHLIITKQTITHHNASDYFDVVPSYMRLRLRLFLSDYRETFYAYGDKGCCIAFRLLG
jgi:hypothetical protein